MANQFVLNGDMESPFVTDLVSPTKSKSDDTYASHNLEQLSPFESFQFDNSGFAQNNLASMANNSVAYNQEETNHLAWLENELSGTELIEAGRLNSLFMRDDQLRWINYATQLIDLLSKYSVMPIRKAGGIDAIAFVNAVEKYQESKALKPTNKGVIAIGTWSQIQDDLGFLKYDKPVKINVTEAIKDNKKYNTDLWGTYLPAMYKYFSSIGLTKDGLPLDSKYFALIVAKWQSLQQGTRLTVDGALGPKSWAVLKPLITNTPAVVPTPHVRTPSRWEALIPGTVVCPAEPILHGPLLFKKMVEAIRTVSGPNHYIYILGWMLDDDFELIPGDSSTTLYNLLSAASSKEGVEIRIMIWNNIFYIKELNKAVTRINKLRNTFIVKDDFTYGSASLKENIRKIQFLVNGAPALLDQLSSWRSLKDKVNVAQNEGSHHEKVMIIKGSSGLIGFCGGIDINPDRLARVDSLGRSIMLHDVHSEVKGYGAWSLLRRFMWRWQVLKESVSPLPGLENCQKDAELPGPGPSYGSSSANVKILQTYNHPLRNIKDRTVRETLKVAIKNARTSIHLEDQYMISLEIADWLNAKLKESSFQKLTILTQDDAIAKPDIQFPKAMRKRFIEHLRRDLTSAQNAKVSIKMLDNNNFFPFQRKVHSKIYIIDNDLAIIGSANCSSRSMTHDSETALVFFNAPGETSFASKLSALLAGDVLKREKDYQANTSLMDKDEELLYDARMYSPIVSIGVPVPIVPVVQLVLPRLKEYLIDIVDPDADNTIPQQEVEFSGEASDSAIVNQLNSVLSDASQLNFSSEAGDYPTYENHPHETGYQAEFTDEHYHSHSQINQSNAEDEFRLNLENVLAETVSTSTARPEGHVSWAKQALNKLTNSGLTINNSLDEPTKAALANFQRSKALPVTGKIDFATERALLESEALQRHAGTNWEKVASQYMVVAKTKIEDWTTRSKIEKVEITNTFRDPGKLWAFVLHQMAIKRRSRTTRQFSDPNSYLRTGAHFCIMFDGRIIQLHPLSRFIWHAQCLSHRSVAVEFEGNFPDINGKWWIGKDSTGKDYPTQAQFNSGRFLLCYLKIVLGTTHVLAHRQGSKNRTNDPGPEIWSNVGQWGMDKMGLTDGGVDFKCGDGNPILPQWRSWTRDTPRVVQEVETENFDDEQFLTSFEEALYEAENNDHGFESEIPPQFQPESQDFYDPEFYDEANFNEEQFNRELQHDHVEEADVLRQNNGLITTEDLVTNITKAVQLNRAFSNSLNWNQYYNEINQLLLPFSGQQNVSLGEEAFAHALAAWQASQGLSAKDADGILGPNTWRLMKPMITSASNQPLQPSQTPQSSPSTSGNTNAQSEWNNHPAIQSRYPTVQLYETIRNQVMSWGITYPAQYIDAAITEWSSNPGMHHHFDHNFDGDPYNSYLNVKRLCSKKGISNIPTYISQNIVSITFFNRNTPGHRDLKVALMAAETSLKAAGHFYTLNSAWSFRPRTIRNRPDSLSNHALGRAIDINPTTNPHVLSAGAIQVINKVCQSALPNGFLAESNPDTFRRASLLFKQTFSDAWISQQSEPDLLTAIRQNRSALNGYVRNGFFDLPTPLVQALQNAGLKWGGTWKSAKDFMHFDLD